MPESAAAGGKPAWTARARWWAAPVALAASAAAGVVATGVVAAEVLGGPHAAAVRLPTPAGAASVAGVAAAAAVATLGVVATRAAATAVPTTRRAAVAAGDSVGGAAPGSWGQRRGLRPTVLGRRRDFPWTRLRLRADDRFHHLCCIGSADSGRAGSVLAPLLRQDLAAGAGVTVLELAGGELCGLARTWCERLGRPVALWEPGDPDSACWNPVADGSPAAAERLVEALRRLRGETAADGGPGAAAVYGGSGGRLVREALATLRAAGRTPDLLALRTLLADAERQRQLLARAGATPAADAAPPSLHGGAAEEGCAAPAGPVLADLDLLLHHPFVRRALGPAGRARAADPVAALRAGGVLLARLPVGHGLRLARCLGGLLLAVLRDALAARGEAEPPHFLYADEFGHFAGADFAHFLALAGSRRVGAVLGHAGTGRPGDGDGQGLQAALLADVRTRVLLRCDSRQAAHLVPAPRQWPPRSWRPDDLPHLPFGLALASVRRGGAWRTAAVRVGGARPRF